MAREKPGLGYEDVVDAVESDGTSARNFLRSLRGKVQELYGEVTPTQLSGDGFENPGTEFVAIDGFVESFESYRAKKGDDAFECQEPERIDAAAKSHIIDAKVNVMITLGHVRKGDLSSAFGKHLKRELNYETVKALCAADLADLWETFKAWKELSKARSDAGESSRTPFLPEDLEKVEAQEKLIAGAKAVLEHLEDQQRNLRSDAGERARNNREQILYEMASAADDAGIEFDSVLRALED